MNVAFATLGCKVNQYETEAMRELFAAAGWEIVPFSERADAYVVNTCTVTGTSDTKSRQLLSRAHRNNPGAIVAAVGCYAQSDPAAVADLAGVSLVVGTDRKAEIVQLVTRALEQRGAGRGALLSVNELTAESAFEPLSAMRDGRTRATLKIEDGCANYCAYCIIPYARGPVRSRPLESVAHELSALAAAGYREIVLTGIHLASYGKDLGGCGLLDVLRLANATPGLTRVRLGSLEPGFVDERFVETVAALPCVCHQFHLSLQSGSDAVLHRMRRRYDTAAYARSAALLRQVMPDCALTTDVIAGFPGETDAEYAETLAFVRGMGFSRVHVFPFSARKGTAAAAMPDQIPKRVREARAAELIALGRELETAFLAGLIGKQLEVLLESDGTGYSREYARVRRPGPEGEIAFITPTAVSGNILIGKEESA